MVGMHDKQSDKAVTLWRYIMILAVGGYFFTGCIELQLGRRD